LLVTVNPILIFNPMLLYTCLPIWLCLSVGLAGIPIAEYSKVKFLDRLSLKWNRALTSAADARTAMVYLDKLIALELFRGNLEQANKYSLMMLDKAMSAEVRPTLELKLEEP